MTPKYEIQATELDELRVEYDIGNTPEAFRSAFDEGSVAIQALSSLGCHTEKAGTLVRVTLPQHPEDNFSRQQYTSMRAGESVSEVDYLISNAKRGFLNSDHTSELSTGVIEGMIAILGFKRNQLTVRRGTSYRN